MKHFDYKSEIFIIIFCVIFCLGLHKFTKIVDRYADKHYEQKFSKKGFK